MIRICKEGRRHSIYSDEPEASDDAQGLTEGLDGKTGCPSPSWHWEPILVILMRTLPVSLFCFASAGGRSSAPKSH